MLSSSSSSPGAKATDLRRLRGGMVADGVFEALTDRLLVPLRHGHRTKCNTAWVAVLQAVCALRHLLFFPEDIQRVVDQIHKHCKKIPVAKVNLPSPYISSILIMWSNLPSRKNLRSLWICATILSNVLAIVPSYCNSLTMRVSRGPFIAPHHLYPADAKQQRPGPCRGKAWGLVEI